MKAGHLSRTECAVSATAAGLLESVLAPTLAKLALAERQRRGSGAGPSAGGAEDNAAASVARACVDAILRAQEAAGVALVSHSAEEALGIPLLRLVTRASFALKQLEKTPVRAWSPNVSLRPALDTDGAARISSGALGGVLFAC